MATLGEYQQNENLETWSELVRFSSPHARHPIFEASAVLTARCGETRGWRQPLRAAAMIAGNKVQLNLTVDCLPVGSFPCGATPTATMRMTTAPSIYVSGSSVVSPSIEASISPSCRTSRVLGSKTTPKTALQKRESSSPSMKKHGDWSHQPPPPPVEPKDTTCGFIGPLDDAAAETSSRPPSECSFLLDASQESTTTRLLRIIKPSTSATEAMIAIAADINAGFQRNVPPIPVDDCTGGVYYLRTKSRRIAVVFKPADEEPYAPNNPKRYLRDDEIEPELPPHPEVQCALVKRSDSKLSSSKSGIRAGIAAGDAAIRGVPAYLLDKHHLASVPMTSLTAAFHPMFHYAVESKAVNGKRARKTGAIQAYVPHNCTADDVSSTLFSVEDVHAIALLDIRLANQDRHGGNVLVVDEQQLQKKTYKLVPIDHGACLPRVCEMEETSFLWLFWSQAKRPFSKSTLQYIASLDPWEDVQLLQQSLPRSHLLEPQALLTLHICTVLLQVCALEKNMSAYDIGMLMCRHGSLRHQQPKSSILEQLVTTSLKDIEAPKYESVQQGQETYFKSVAASFQRHLASYLTTM
ncbi:Phosphatidylinositol kinase, partial [Globisporangium splendens]